MMMEGIANIKLKFGDARRCHEKSTRLYRCKDGVDRFISLANWRWDNLNCDQETFDEAIAVWLPHLTSGKEDVVTFLSVVIQVFIDGQSRNRCDASNELIMPDLGILYNQQKPEAAPLWWGTPDCEEEDISPEQLEKRNSWTLKKIRQKYSSGLKKLEFEGIRDFLLDHLNSKELKRGFPIQFFKDKFKGLPVEPGIIDDVITELVLTGRAVRAAHAIRLPQDIDIFKFNLQKKKALEGLTN